ncbi:MAG: SHOCT domain-containing protein [Eubacteriales bacterium]
MMPFIFAPFGLIGGLIGLLILVCIIGAIIRAIVFAAHGGRYHHYRHHGHWDNDSGQDDATAGARKILDERYAKGEIDDEEYKKKKENLK